MSNTDNTIGQQSSPDRAEPIAKPSELGRKGAEIMREALAEIEATVAITLETRRQTKQMLQSLDEGDSEFKEKVTAELSAADTELETKIRDGMEKMAQKFSEFLDALEAATIKKNGN